MKIAPQKADNQEAQTAGLGRMSLDKQFHGDIEASAAGEMLSAMTEVQGSGAYVALDRVKGTLHGRSGSFLLVHRGIMTRGMPQLEIEIVPDSGTGELAGITGKLAIRVEAGKHFYTLEYELPAS